VSDAGGAAIVGTKTAASTLKAKMAFFFFFFGAFGYASSVAFLLASSFLPSSFFGSSFFVSYFFGSSFFVSYFFGSELVILGVSLVAFLSSFCF